MTDSNGKYIPHQFIVHEEDTVKFKSYNCIIASRNVKTGEITLDKNLWDWAVTTARYRAKFLGETTRETRKKVLDGVYTLEDLNN